MLNIPSTTTTTRTRERPRYELVLCEYFHHHIHGFDDDSDPCIDSHYLVHTRFPVPGTTSTSTTTTTSSTDPWKHLQAVCVQLHRLYRNLLHTQAAIDTIGYMSNGHRLRHYRHLAENPLTYLPQLAEVYHLRGGECVAVLKTFWLRLVQRSWKRVFAKRQDVLRRRGRPEELAWFQRMGKWSPECGALPSVRGMLALPARPALRSPAA